jgi:hypothetical protein
VQRRRCETCEFHEPGLTACTGRCRNLDWQPAGGAPRFVRARETACYRGWGIDHWQPKHGGGPGGSNGSQGPKPGGGGTPNRYSGATGSSASPIIPLQPVLNGVPVHDSADNELGIHLND